MGDLYVVIGGCEEEVGNCNRLGIGQRIGHGKVTVYRDDGFVRNLPDLIMGRWDHACAGFQDINGDMVGVILFCSFI